MKLRLGLVLGLGLDECSHSSEAVSDESVRVR